MMQVSDYKPVGEFWEAWEVFTHLTMCARQCACARKTIAVPSQWSQPPGLLPQHHCECSCLLRVPTPKTHRGMGGSKVWRDGAPDRSLSLFPPARNFRKVFFTRIRFWHAAASALALHRRLYAISAPFLHDGQNWLCGEFCAENGVRQIPYGKIRPENRREIREGGYPRAVALRFRLVPVANLPLRQHAVRSMRRPSEDCTRLWPREALWPVSDAAGLLRRAVAVIRPQRAPQAVVSPRAACVVAARTAACGPCLPFSPSSPSSCPVSSLKGPAHEC